MSLRAKIKKVAGALTGLSEAHVDPDPIVQFKRWFEEATHSGIELPESVTVATATRDGAPSARMMLLKGVDDLGFRFYTNFDSRKGAVLKENPRVALVFHWAELARQVRVEGAVERLSDEESNAYFQSRPRGSRIGAWASAQSSVLRDRAELEAKAAERKQEFAGGEVPLPPFWGGYLVKPERIEFWQGRADRLHDRLCYTRGADTWELVRLAP
jgi:pyridoxamine 5'-phosphate oxidase